MGNILLIDDDTDSLTYLQHILRPSAHTIYHAESTEQALQLAGKNSISLIFLDLNMPGFDGFDFLKLFDSIYPKAKTPIIVISANKSKNAYKQVMSLGAREFIAKPISNKLSLLRTVEKYIGE